MRKSERAISRGLEGSVTVLQILCQPVRRRERDDSLRNQGSKDSSELMKGYRLIFNHELRLHFFKLRRAREHEDKAD